MMSLMRMRKLFSGSFLRISICSIGLLSFFCLLFALSSLSSCSGGKGRDGGAGKGDFAETAGGEMDSLLYAKNLRIEKFIPSQGGANESEREKGGNGDSGDIYIATVRNPWDTVKRMERYILVPKGMDIPQGLPEGTVVRVPVDRALVYSSLHGGLIKDLGAAQAIGGVCNARYITDKSLRERIAKGEVADCGEGMNPDIEKIIQLHPEAILLSPFENNDRYGKVTQMGIPIIECADYMETTPLGQAEWMKFYGLLFGKGEEARQRFEGIASRYNEIKAEASKNPRKPKVMMDAVYSGSWSVPGGESTMGRLIEDAGGINPFAGYRQSGGVPLAPERVLKEAGDADIWLLRYNQGRDKTLAELGRDAPVNSQFKAFREGAVYGCNTAEIPFFDETPFHPDWLLEEMAGIFASSSDSQRLSAQKQTRDNGASRSTGDNGASRSTGDNATKGAQAGDHKYFKKLEKE